MFRTYEETMTAVGYPKVYITLDVEAAGPILGRHDLLSLGACVVTKTPLTLVQKCEMDLTFYAELAPNNLEYEKDAMRAACSHLECLETKRKEDARYDSTSHIFDPELVLRYMQECCEPSSNAVTRFSTWTNELSWRFTDVVPPKITPIIDAPFFDPGHINTWLGLGKHIAVSPLGRGGHNLKDLYRGHTGRENASLKELGAEPPEKPHHSLHDAYELSQQARIVIFKKLRWDEKVQRPPD